jgi:hypothetical protein
MADNKIEVVFSADIAELVAGVETAKTMLASLAAQAQALAAQMGATSAAADAAFAHLGAASASTTAASQALAPLSSGISEALTPAAGEAGAALAPVNAAIAEALAPATAAATEALASVPIAVGEALAPSAEIAAEAMAPVPEAIGEVLAPAAIAAEEALAPVTVATAEALAPVAVAAADAGALGVEAVATALAPMAGAVQDAVATAAAAVGEAFGPAAAGVERSLAASVEIARAQLARLNGEARTLARTMVETGQAADAGLVSKLALIKTTSSAVEEQIAAMTGAMAGAAGSIEGAARAATTGGLSMRFMTREARALADEAASGRWRQFDGTIVGIATHGFQAAAAFAAANPILTAFGVASALAAGATAYFTIQAYEAAKSADQLRTALDFSGQSSLASDQKFVAGLVEGIKTATGEVGDKAREILATLSTMKNGSRDVFSSIVSDLSGFTEALGDKPIDATKKLVALFSDPLDAGKKLNDLLPGLTAAQREQYDVAQKTGDLATAQAALQSIVVQNLAAEREGRIQKILVYIDLSNGSVRSWYHSVSSSVPADA